MKGIGLSSSLSKHLESSCLNAQMTKYDAIFIFRDTWIHIHRKKMILVCVSAITARAQIHNSTQSLILKNIILSYMMLIPYFLIVFTSVISLALPSLLLPNHNNQPPFSNKCVVFNHF